MAYLKRDYGIQCRNAVELGSLAASFWIGNSSKSYDFVRMVEAMPNVDSFAIDVLSKIPCEVAFGDWGSTTLSKEQIMHCSIDAYAAFSAGCKFFYCFS